MSLETSIINVQQFINDFEKLYNDDRATIFELFERSTFSTSDKQKIFAALKDKQKQNLYNTISVFAY